MNQIKCPNCGQVFTIDEASYASILKQVRDHEFAEELEQRKNEALRAAQAEQESLVSKLQAEQESRVSKLQAEQETIISQLQAEKESLRQREVPGNPK